MGVIAIWGNKTFEINPNKIYPLTDFQTAFKLKSDANSDTSGTDPINTRGRELETITFSTKLVAGLGVNVRNEFGSWRKLVGQSHPIIIGGASFGAGNFQLNSVDISESELDVNGNFLMAKLSFTFTEFFPSDTAATSKSVSETNTATTNEDVLSLSASATDRENKNPYT